MPDMLPFVEDAVDVGEALSKGGDVSEALLEGVIRGGKAVGDLPAMRELAPTIDRIVTDDVDVGRGESALLNVNSPLEVSLDQDGHAFIKAFEPGYVLHGGGFGGMMQDTFEGMRQSVPLNAGESVPLGRYGDYIFKPGEDSFRPISIRPTGSEIGGQTWLVATQDSGSLSTRVLTRLATTPGALARFR